MTHLGLECQLVSRVRTVLQMVRPGMALDDGCVDGGMDATAYTVITVTPSDMYCLDNRRTRGDGPGPSALGDNLSRSPSALQTRCSMIVSCTKVRS